MSPTRTPGASAYRMRVVLGTALVAVLVAGAWLWSLATPVTRTVTAQEEQRLSDLAAVGVVLLEHSDLSAADAAVGVSGDSGVRTTIVAEDGTVLADTEEDPATLRNHGDRPEVRSALAGQPGSDIRRSETQGVERMYVALPATYRGAPVALRVSESLEHVDRLAATMRRSGLLPLALVLIVAAMVVAVVARVTAGPVERLALAARAMADGDLVSEVPADDGALAPLSSALADLRGQLRARLDALETEERTLRLAFNGLSDAVILLDGPVVRLTNRAFRTMFRTTPAGLRGRTLAEVGLPASVEAAIKAGLDSADAVASDLGPDPYHRYHHVLSVPLGESDGAERTLVVIADVTDRMRLDAVRRDFVANASHELKTPTAGILLLAESAEAAAHDGDTATALAFIPQIHGEATRLKRMVSDLLDLSRLESAPDPGDVADVRRAIDLAFAGHRRAANAKGLGLTAQFDAVSGSDVVARLSATDLAVLLDNLLSNAIAYTEEGSIAVRIEADDDTVTLHVSDTGIGIPSQDVERVFERFYRVDRARSRTSGGTGLGLSLVRNIAHRAGGTAGISSEVDRGTTVTITLPRAR